MIGKTISLIKFKRNSAKAGIPPTRDVLRPPGPILTPWETVQ